MDFDALISLIYRFVLGPVFEDYSLYWPFLLAALSIALGWSYAKSGSLLKALRGLGKRKIWLSASSRLDYKVVFINAFIVSALFPLILFSSQTLAIDVRDLLASFIHHSPPPEPAPVFSGLYTLALILWVDFLIYWTHRILHKSRWLWQCHQQHHSAQVLTPFTSMRSHPIENYLNALISLLGSGVVIGVFHFYFGPNVGEVTLFGINIILFVFYLFGGVLTHSHIHLHWPAPLSWMFVSPAVHQIHHSKDPKHINKNFGMLLCIWDRLFGTYCPPTPGENLRFGLSQSQPQSLRHFYFGLKRPRIKK